MILYVIGLKQSGKSFYINELTGLDLPTGNNGGYEAIISCNQNKEIRDISDDTLIVKIPFQSEFNQIYEIQDIDNLNSDEDFCIKFTYLNYGLDNYGQDLLYRVREKFEQNKLDSKKFKGFLWDEKDNPKVIEFTKMIMGKGYRVL